MAVAYRLAALRFANIADQPGAVWLDSGDGTHHRGRWDIIASDPEQCAPMQQSGASLDRDIFALMQQWHRASAPTDGTLPFYGGSIGYLGYDLNRSLERLVAPASDPTELPSAWIGYYGWALVQDIAARKAWLVADSPSALSRAHIALATMDAEAAPAPPAFRLRDAWQASSPQATYLAAIAQVKRYIEAGDCYQVNLAQHFSAPYEGHPWGAYLAVRQALPSPFSAYLNTGAGCLLSHSPERLLEIDQGLVTTSPIKGTRPRGKSPKQDQQLADALLESGKDKAENLMIVDLLRNDLGRSCRPGTIEVDGLFQLESYANVHHLVSTIRGTLRTDVSPPQALRNAFPGGSVTGAPKIRAMDIINSLEPVSRSAYCGSVMYYSNHGRLDSNIAIRSLVADGQSMHCWGGGGIVADSDAASEYAESLSKIELLMATLSALSPS